MKDVMIRILATQLGDDPRETTELAEFSTEGQLECADGVGRYMWNIHAHW